MSLLHLKRFDSGSNLRGGFVETDVKFHSAIFSRLASFSVFQKSKQGFQFSAGGCCSIFFFSSNNSIKHVAAASELLGKNNPT